ncbi:sigma 54-interacting transcriptional regulator [Symbiobacterium terraclitae]|uniref:sigma 54-interacting transcriptional regulator n=1 Tax=Symbiobacterium terraclitae TaxID=557451 RepID=UPI0035B5481D
MSYPPIVFVLPFQRLAESAVEVSRQLGIPTRAEVGDLDMAIAPARAAEAAGAEVIISRGGTASVIAAAVSIPVVEIRVTSSDVLRCISQVASFPGKVGLAGFQNIIYGCEEVGAHLGLEIVPVTIPSQTEARRVIAEAKRCGVGHIIGDHISCLCAREVGLPATLIESGREGIAQALFEAQHVLRVRREERAKAQQIRTILNSVRDGILAADADGRVVLTNPRAEQLLGQPARSLEGQLLTELFPSIGLDQLRPGGHSQVDIVQTVGETRLAVTVAPVRVEENVVGSVLTFRDVTDLQRHEQIVRQKLHKKGLVAKAGLEQLAGTSSAIRQVVSTARRYARSDATVLIQGESGTGKELVAQGIHRASPRSAGPFVAVNCASMPEALLQSELFGYEEGAFTGARRGGKPGLFELAHGGTIFLDEIGEMPYTLQSHLLRVLQEKEVMRIGGESVIPVNVRVVAATNRALEVEVAEGRFRADLYYRLNVLRLDLPPLRDRLEDIPALVELLTERLAGQYGLRRRLTPAAVAALGRYDWPGNVRELKNLLERLWLITDGDLIDENAVVSQLPVRRAASTGAASGQRATGPAREAAAPSPTGAARSEEWPAAMTLEEIEHLAIRKALEAEGGNLGRAARRLGIHRTTLYRKLQHGVAIQQSE